MTHDEAWCDSKIDAKRDFDRDVLVEVVAD
jgi:hypothetical protein